MDVNTGGIADSFANFVWEPAVVKVSVCNLSSNLRCVLAMKISFGVVTCAFECVQ